MRELSWWLRFDWGGHYPMPYMWIGPVLITWQRPCWGDKWGRDYWFPRNIGFAWDPD